MSVESKERYSEAAATKLTPSQIAFIEMARTFARLMDDPEFRFKSERDGQGDLAAFYREAILYYSKAIMARAQTTLNGKNLVTWALERVGDPTNGGK